MSLKNATVAARAGGCGRQCRGRLRTLTRGVWYWAMGAVCFWACAAGVAQAQDEQANFRKPVLVVETEGHRAPVWALAWADNDTLLSAGLDKVVKVWDRSAGGRLRQTIRPPLWRGPAGSVYALAGGSWPWPDTA